MLSRQISCKLLAAEDFVLLCTDRQGNLHLNMYILSVLILERWVYKFPFGKTKKQAKKLIANFHTVLVL